MLIRMKVAKDLFYIDEIVDAAESYAQDWIARGYAEIATCLECGFELKDAGCRVYCPNCGFKHNIHL